MGFGSEIRDPEKTYSGSRIQDQKGTGSRIRIRNTAKIFHFSLNLVYSYTSWNPVRDDLWAKLDHGIKSLPSCNYRYLFGPKETNYFNVFFGSFVIPPFYLCIVSQRGFCHGVSATGGTRPTTRPQPRQPDSPFHSLPNNVGDPDLHVFCFWSSRIRIH